MIANILNNKLENIVRISSLLLDKGYLDAKVFLSSFIEQFDLKDIDKKFYRCTLSFKGSRNKKCISINTEILNQLMKKDLSEFISIIIDRKDSKEYIPFFMNHCSFFQFMKDEDFRLIINQLKNKDKERIYFKDKLSEEKIKILIDSGFSLKKNRESKHILDNIYFYIKNEGELSHKVICHFYKTIGDFHFGSKTYLKKIIIEISKLILSKDDSLLIDNETKTSFFVNEDLGSLLDKVLVRKFSVKEKNNTVWKLKIKYNKKNNIEYNLIFHDIIRKYPIDEFVKQDNYKFTKIVKNKTILKNLYIKTFQGNYIIPYYYRAIASLKNLFPNIDEQLFIKIFDYDYEFLKYLFDANNGIKEILNSKMLNEHFSERKIFNILTYSLTSKEIESMSKNYFNDIINVYNNLILKEWKPSFKKKHKNIILLHDYLNSEMKKQSQENFSLNQEDIYYLDDQKIDEYLIKVPKTNHDLIEVGSTLHHCVGNGSYSLEVLKKKIYIVTMYKDKKIQGCVAISRNNGVYRVNESRSYHNDVFKFSHDKLYSLLKQNDKNK